MAEPSPVAGRSDDELVTVLGELAGALRAPAGEDLVDTVRRRLVAARRRTTPRRRAALRRVVLAAAAAVVLAIAIVSATPQARHAVADWLGIGAVEIRTGQAPPSQTIPLGGPSLGDA